VVKRQLKGGQQRHTIIHAFFCRVSESRVMALFNGLRHPLGGMGLGSDDSETQGCRLPGLNGDVIWVYAGSGQAT
jgi:hypothetical protein